MKQLWYLPNQSAFTALWWCEHHRHGNHRSSWSGKSSSNPFFGHVAGEGRSPTRVLGVCLGWRFQTVIGKLQIFCYQTWPGRMEHALLNDMELLLWRHVKQSHVEIASTAKKIGFFPKQWRSFKGQVTKLVFLVLSIRVWWGETLWFCSLLKLKEVGQNTPAVSNGFSCCLSRLWRDGICPEVCGDSFWPLTLEAGKKTFTSSSDQQESHWISLNLTISTNSI